MIDHVSVGVTALAVAERLYEAALAPLGYEKLVVRPGSIGFGKRYPEFWLHARPAMPDVPAGMGDHVALRAASRDAVDLFHRAALAGGASDDGRPGLRAYSRAQVYSAFIRDPDGNRIEAMTIVGEVKVGDAIAAAGTGAGTGADGG